MPRRIILSKWKFVLLGGLPGPGLTGRQPSAQRAGRRPALSDFFHLLRLVERLLIAILGVGLALALLSSGGGTWAMPAQCASRQTIPTRTPTRPPGSPTQPPATQPPPTQPPPFTVTPAATSMAGTATNTPAATSMAGTATVTATNTPPAAVLTASPILPTRPVTPIQSPSPTGAGGLGATATTEVTSPSPAPSATATVAAPPSPTTAPSATPRPISSSTGIDVPCCVAGIVVFLLILIALVYWRRRSTRKDTA